MELEAKASFDIFEYSTKNGTPYISVITADYTINKVVITKVMI